MRLTLEDGTAIDQPTAEAIERALRTLNWLEDNSFAILERGDMTYLQTAQEDVPEVEQPFFVLEYQDGSVSEHYRVCEGPLPLERIIRAFQKYADQDDSWRGEFEWERMELS
jgi:hypothetical protein